MKGPPGFMKGSLGEVVEVARKNKKKGWFGEPRKHSKAAKKGWRKRKRKK